MDTRGELDAPLHLQREHCFCNLCLGPVSPALSLSHSYLSPRLFSLELPFILAPLPLRCAFCHQAWCDIRLKHRNLSVPLKGQKQQRHAHTAQDGLLAKSRVFGDHHPPHAQPPKQTFHTKQCFDSCVLQSDVVEEQGLHPGHSGHAHFETRFFLSGVQRGSLIGSLYDPTVISALYQSAGTI